MSEAFTEILGTAERAAVGSETDKSALARLLSGIDLAGLGTPEDRAYLAVLLDWLGMQEQAMLALRPGDGELGVHGAEMPNLAGMLASGHGEHERAEELFLQALSAAGDRTHVRVKILANLAALSLLTGEIGTAATWLVRASEARGQAGDPATDVLLASTEFGIARAQGDPAGMRVSVSRLNEATRARMAELGSDHPLAVTAVGSLASAEFELASAEESAEGQERAIGVLEVAAHRLAADLGADHPQALTCLENMCVADFRLARASRSSDRTSRAASMLETVSQRTSAALGEDHPQARTAATNAAAARLELQGTRTNDAAPPSSFGLASQTLPGTATSKASQREVQASTVTLPSGLTSSIGRAATTTVHDVLRMIRETSATNHERGSRFEKLMRSYLGIDPTWTEQFSKVWLWADWPGAVANKQDTGIDLVAQDRETGGFCAIQCKFYEPDHTVQKADID